MRSCAHACAGNGTCAGTDIRSCASAGADANVNAGADVSASAAARASADAGAYAGADGYWCWWKTVDAARRSSDCVLG